MEESMKRMFACLLLILVVPIITAFLQPGASCNAPFASTALAGHTLAGGFCQCGCPGCFCDPGENLDMCIPERLAQQLSGNTSAPTPTSGADVPAVALFIGTGLLMLKRLRK